MLDLDHFKSINDRFGHLEGDRALVAFAQVVKGELRASDVVGRLGGEEFGVLLPLTAIDEGLEVATRILDSLRALELVDDAGQRYGITASMGVGAFRQTDRSLRDALDRADQALYLAKHRGRNQMLRREGAAGAGTQLPGRSTQVTAPSQAGAPLHLALPAATRQQANAPADQAGACCNYTQSPMRSSFHNMVGADVRRSRLSMIIARCPIASRA